MHRIFGENARQIPVSQTPLLACIDDDPSICEAIKELLKASGFTAKTFLSAEEFLQSARLEDTSCLIMDVQLGGMSGLQLQNRLAESGYGIPIIFITAFPDERIRERALSAGAVCFLSKPVTKEGLLTCIHAALHRGDGTGHSL
jgi:FixJ family two-component response regulator